MQGNGNRFEIDPPPKKKEILIVTKVYLFIKVKIGKKMRKTNWCIINYLTAFKFVRTITKLSCVILNKIKLLPKIDNIYQCMYD